MSAKSAVISVKVVPLKTARCAGQFRGSLREWSDVNSEIRIPRPRRGTNSMDVTFYLCQKTDYK
jgi:hypothetical protein